MFLFSYRIARRAEKRKSKDDSPPPSFNGSDSNGSNSGSATNVSFNNKNTNIRLHIEEFRNRY